MSDHTSSARLKAGSKGRVTRERKDKRQGKAESGRQGKARERQRNGKERQGKAKERQGKGRQRQGKATPGPLYSMACLSFEQTVYGQHLLTLQR